MTWATKIDAIYLDCAERDGWRCRPEYRDPAASDDLALLESTFALLLPESLRSLLMETNGVMNMMSVETEEKGVACSGESFETIDLAKFLGSRNSGSFCNPANNVLYWFMAAVQISHVSRWYLRLVSS